MLESLRVDRMVPGFKMLVMALAQALKTLEKEGGFRSEQATAILEAIEVSADKTRQELQVSAHREFATKADLQELKADLVKWIFGLLVSQAVVVLGGVWFMLSQAVH